MIEDSYLLHFTSFFTTYKKFRDRDDVGFKNLIRIIKQGFRFNKRGTYTPRESKGKPSIKMDIGMLCFTEVDLKTIKGNIEKFGKFGICMKKEWVKKFSGQPVLYSFEESVNNKLLNNLSDLITKTHNIFL